jgi:Leucine-rich repeat (LRR) protein
VLPTLTFENLNSLEQLNLQNNKMDRLPEELMEPVMDTLRILDATGKNNIVKWQV